jgi:TIR domain
MANDKPKIFISHISEEAEIAELFKSEIESAFLGLVDVFVSANAEDIGLGSNWLLTIEEQLKNCQAMLVLCSPYSVTEPWINFESGAGWARGIEIAPLCHSGLRPVDLPIPLSLRQGIEASDHTKIDQIFRLIAKKLNSSVPAIDVQSLADRIKVFEKHYTEAKENAARRASDDTLTHVDETAKKQLRAYVYLDSEKIIERLHVVAGEEPQYLLRTKNYGLTPAYKLVVASGCGVGPWPPNEDVPIPNVGEGTQVLPPGAISYWGNAPGGRVSAEDFADMRAGARRFYIFGRISYVDAFDNARYTNFCLGIIPPSDPNSGAGFGLQRCPRQNDSS